MNVASRYLPNKLRRLRFRLRCRCICRQPRPEDRAFCDVDDGGKRPAVPGRGGCSHGAPDAAPLDTRSAQRAVARTRRNAGQASPAGRGSRRFPRHARPARRTRRILPAPEGLAGAGPQRGVRPALPVSRLEVRRGRQRSGHAVGASAPPSAEGEAQGLSRPRGRRLRLGLHGTRGPDARIRGAAVGADAGGESQRRAHGCLLQLGADHGGPDRFGAQLHPAFVGHEASARRHRDRGRDVAASIDRQVAAHSGRAHQLRHALRGHPPADQEPRHA